MLAEAAQSQGGSELMRGLRERMRMIENDLEAAENSTKEQFALEHLRARMEKVERLLTEGERAAKDWEALEDLRAKIGNVDNDLKAVEGVPKYQPTNSWTRGVQFVMAGGVMMEIPCTGPGNDARSG